MGLLFIQSVKFADIPVMAAYLCLIALVFVLINLVVDLLYYAVDPRLRIDARRRRTERGADGSYLGAALRGPLAAILPHHEGLAEFRRDLHAHPELGFEEHRTAALVAERLRSFGIEHAHRHRPHRRRRA